MAKRIISPEERAKRSAGAKAAKERLRADPEAYARFRARTSAAVKKQWTIGREMRVKNISRAIIAKVATMTPEQRRQTFGWMNAEHITAERKRALWEMSLKKWWDEIDEATRTRTIEKRNSKIIKSVKGALRIFDNSLPEDHPVNAWALRVSRPVFTFLEDQ